jgi:hypothetical protein
VCVTTAEFRGKTFVTRRKRDSFKVKIKFKQQLGHFTQQHGYLLINNSQIRTILLLELLGNRLIEPVFFNSLPRSGLSISFWDDLYFVFPPVGI